MRRTTMLFALLGLSARPQELSHRSWSAQEDPEILRAQELLHKDPAKGVRALEEIAEKERQSAKGRERC